MKFHIARNGQQLGMFQEYEVRAKVQSGEFLASDLYWCEGMAEWAPLASLPGATGASLNPYSAPAAPLYRPMPGYAATDLATLGQRLGAAVLDSLVLVAAAAPIAVGAFLLDNPNGNETVGGIVVGLGCVLVLAVIVINLVMLSTRGQSLAKKWLDIRIVDNDTGNRPGFVKAVLLRGFVNGIIGQVVPLYGLVDVCFIFREDHRCIYDLMAGTRVVRGQPVDGTP